MYRLSTLISLLVLGLISGCAVPKNNYQPVAISISDPPLGSVNIKRVGDEMLRQGRYREHDALHVQAVLKPHWAYTVYPGYFLKSGEDDSGHYFRIGYAGEDSGYVEKALLADPYQSLMVKKDGNVLCVVTVFNATGCLNGVNSGFEMTKKPIVSQDAVQRTLIYSGKSGNKINIGYREFAGNLAVVGFSNNVEYDLNESMRIGYKGAELDVIEATNTFIKYKVISNFNNAVK